MISDLPKFCGFCVNFVSTEIRINHLGSPFTQQKKRSGKQEVELLDGIDDGLFATTSTTERVSPLTAPAPMAKMVTGREWSEINNYTKS